MASLTRWTRVWVNSGSWWWTGRPGVLGFMGSQRVRHDWETELYWTELMSFLNSFHFYSSQIENITTAKIARFLLNIMDFPHGSDGKEGTCNSGDPGSIPGSGRSPEEGNSNQLQYSWLENFMDRGAWHATVHWVTKSWTRLSSFRSFLSTVPTSSL